MYGPMRVSLPSLVSELREDVLHDSQTFLIYMAAGVRTDRREGNSSPLSLSPKLGEIALPFVSH